MERTALEQRVFSLVASITGHQPNQLEPDMYLESELGLDSIKMLEFFNGMIQLVPEAKREAFSLQFPVQKLMQIQILRDAIDIVKDWQDFEEVATVKTVDFQRESNIITFQPEQKIENVEILHSQYLHLMSHWVVNSNSLCYSLRWQGAFDVNVAQQSWKELVARHPMLRVRFSIPADATSFKDYQLTVLENPKLPEIPVADIRHLSKDKQERFLEEEFQKWLNFEWQLVEFPLHQFFVYRLENSVYQFFFANEHVVSDGLGNQFILREFMEIYGARICGEEPELPPPTSVKEYQELVEKMNSWKAAEEEKALGDYISRQGKDSYLWNPEKKNFSAHLRPKFHNIRYCLERDITKKLIAKTRDWRLPVNSLLLAAFLKAVTKLEQSSQSLIIQVPTSGRVYPGIDASNVVSSFAQNLGLTFARPQLHEDWEILVNRVHQEIQNGLANGYDRVQSQQMARVFRDAIRLEHGKLPEHSISMFRSSLKSNLFFPYTGQTHLKTRYASVELTDYRAGGINAIGTLDLLQEIFDDRLYFFASYDSNCFSESLIASLIEEYIAQIKELISYSISAKETKQAIAKPQIDASIEITLRQIAEEICHYPIALVDMDKDLEADLGMDSLELVRIVTRLEQRFGKMNRQALLSCRTLREIASVLEVKQSPSINQNQPVIPVQIPNKKLPEIPYLQIIEQAKRTPNAIAVLDGETQLTYKELHQISNQIANYLRSQGVGANSLVGIMMRRGPLMLAGILGILKAGGAYVPLDPSYPRERIRYILEHAEIKILVTEDKLTEKLTECLTEKLPLQTLMFLDEAELWQGGKAWEQVNKKTWSNWSQLEPNCVNTSDDLMTVLYTSGSTGKPKGVMLNHQGYMNRLQWMQKAFQLQPGERVAQKTSCCFDISVWELFWPLMVGATVCPVETETVKNPWLLAQWMKDTQINILHFVPSLFGEFITALEADSWTFPDLRWLIFSGEALPVPFIQRWIDKYDMSVGLANLYGPTEASIDVTAHIIHQRPQENSIPIGKAIDNVYLTILDQQMHPVAPGEMGELWIGGVQLAKGYLKDTEKTSNAFCPNPFAEIPGEYLYRTGDLATQSPDGSIEYHGRIDHQVKIRGFRVELGEIENVLMSHSAVNEAGVLAIDYGNGEKRLVAFLAGAKGVANSTPNLQEFPNQVNKDIKEYLQQRLPHYMIPHRLEWLPSLPKNHNGKLDRKAIQAIFNENSSTPEKQPSTVSDEYLPLGPAQRWLIEYFAPTYQWTGYTRFRYQQPLDQDAFNQSINLLVERHYSLRTVFVQKDGQWWQQLIQKEKPLSAEFYEGSHLEPEERDREIYRLTQQMAQQLRIDKFPLLKVFVVKIHDSCYDITIVGHHIIGDLLSNNLIFQELWSIYSQVLGKQNHSLAPSKSYADYIHLLLEADKQGNLASHIDYWKSQFPTGEPAFKIPLDRETGANLEASAASDRFTLSTNDSNTLLRQAKQYYECNLYPILLAPLYKLMAEWSGNSKVVLSHRSHGRNVGNNQTFLESVGNFAVNFPVGIALSENAQWKQKVKQIVQAFDELPMNGITYDWISDQLPDRIYPDRKLTPVRANYLGNRSLPVSNLFEFIESDRDRRLSPPEQKRTTLLEFFFSIVDGKFNLEIEYSQNFHQPETIRKLGDRYLELMQDMLAEISKPQAAKLTPHQLQARNLPLNGKVAIVTEGNGAIGKAIALNLAQQGASVAVVARNLDELAETIAQIRQQGLETLAIAADISDLNQVEAIVKKVVSQFGGIDILVNNAGVGDFAELANLDSLHWRQIIDANIVGTYNCCQSVISYLNQRGKGKIVNLGSDSSLIGSPWFSAYAAAKHAIVGLTKSLAEELKQQNIQVNAVCPTFVKTNTNFKAFQGFIPAEQVAEVVSFLTSPLSDGITGECLKISGK